MKKRYIAAVLMAALALSLGAAALADEPGQTDPTAQPVQQEETLDVGQNQGQTELESKPSQDIPQPEQEKTGPEGESGQTSAPTVAPTGTLTWDQLETQVRAGDLKILILEENIAAARATDFDKLKEDLRDQLNSIANQQWQLLGGGSSGSGPDYSYLFTDPNYGASPQDQYLYGAVNALQTGMSAMSSMMTSSARQSLQSAYDAVREQYDNLKDGKTQKTVDDNVRMLKNMTDSEVLLAQATYAQLVELDAALDTMDRSLAALDRQVEELELRYELGQISALALKQVKSGRDSLASQRETYAMQARSGLMGLEFMTGRDLTGTLKLGSLPAVTAEQVTAMDLEKDMAAAKEKSWTLYDAKNTLDDAKEDFDDAGKEYNHNEKKYQYVQAQHTWQAAQYTYQAAVTGFELTFRGLYDKVKDARQVLDAAKTALAVQKDTYAAQELKYQQGTIAKNALLTAKDDLAAAQDKVDSAQRSLFTAYNNYRWAVEYGIAN